MLISTQLPSAKVLVPWTLALFAGMAFAQPPADAEASAPRLPTTLQYSSAIGTYKAYSDQSVQPWREANDRVGEIGGWRAYAKEMKTQEPANDMPSNDPHAGHHGGGKP